jgi:hypothetical protein
VTAIDTELMEQRTGAAQRRLNFTLGFGYTGLCQCPAKQGTFDVGADPCVRRGRKGARAGAPLRCMTLLKVH